MNELFQRPANYWLRHADRHKQSGDLLRAVVLQRHAVRADTGSDAARMQYALTLRQLRCYEASNREAFRTLAAQPQLQELYGLIGCNMIDMGMKREGLDALDAYFRACIPAGMPWHEEACDFSEIYDAPVKERRRRARLDGLLAIAARRMSRGDLDGVERALKRACRKPFQGFSARRELMQASYFLHRGNWDMCQRHLAHAMEQAKQRCSVFAAAAGIMHQAGRRKAAQRLLLLAAVTAQNPSDRRLVCHTAASVNAVFIAQAMLHHNLRSRPRRVPVLYDLCVCALRLGNLQEALRHIHLCREIDPDDIPSETLFARVMEWQQHNLSRKALRTAALGVSFYGACSENELAAYARPLWDALGDSPQALADALIHDDRVRRRLLFVMTLHLEWPAMLLGAVCGCMPKPECEALLREVLIQHPADTPAKRSAMALLHRMGAPAPYDCWTRDRFLPVDPEKLYAPVPTFRQRRLTMFLHKLAGECGTESIPWALGVVSRLSPAQQCRLIGDPWKVWQLAMMMRWHALNGLPPVQVPFQTLSVLRLNALKKALWTIDQAD